MNKAKYIWDKLWRDKNGQVAIWQAPNVPLWTWFIFMVVGKLLSSGTLKSFVQLVALLALMVWAFLEVIEGTSYFRRLLGALVLAAIITSR